MLRARGILKRKLNLDNERKEAKHSARVMAALCQDTPPL